MRRVSAWFLRLQAEHVAPSLSLMSVQVAHESSPVLQDILKGSGKLVDNHTVKYSLPGEGYQNPIKQTDLVKLSMAAPVASEEKVAASRWHDCSSWPSTVHG